MAKSGTNFGLVDLSSYLTDEVLADLPPIKWQLEIPTDRFLL